MEPPWKPQQSDCCNSGCNPCILDVYDEQLKKNQRNLASETSSKVNGLSPMSYRVFELLDRIPIAPDVYLFTFKYNDPNYPDATTLQYNPGQYLILRADDEKGCFSRAYSPVECQGLHFTALVRLVPDGRISKLLNTLKLGAELKWRGPYGDFLIDYSLKHILFVAQGTGIAPILPIIREMVLNEECETFITLFFCCRNLENIFFREDLFEFSAFWNFKCEIFLNDSGNIKRKYNEIIHERKLTFHDLRIHLGKLKNVQVAVSGNEVFGSAIKEYLEKIQITNIYLF